MFILHTLALSTLSMLGGHSSLHPADAELYVECPDTRGMVAAFPRAAVGQLLLDEEVRLFAAAIAGEDPETFDLEGRLFEEIEGLYEEMPGAMLALSLFQDSEAISLSVSGLDLDGMVPALVSSELTLTPELLAATEDLQLRIVVEFPESDGEVLAKLLDTLVAFVPVQPGQHEIETLEVMRLSDNLEAHTWNFPELGGRQLFAALDHSRLIVGLGIDSARRFAAETSSLASTESFASSDDAFQDVQGVYVYDAYFNVEGLRGVAQSLSDVVDAPEDASAYVDAILGLAVPSDHVELRRRSCFSEGRFVTEEFERFHGDTHGLQDVLGVESVSPKTFSLVPQEAVAVWATTLDRVALGDLLSRSLVDWSGGSPEALLDELESTYGLRPQEDLIASLGQRIVFYVMPFSGIGAPKMFLALELEDPEGFTRGMQALGELASTVTAGGIEYQSKPYRKQPFISLQPSSDVLPGAGGMTPALFTPNLAIGVLDGRAIISLSNIYTKREMKRMLKEGGEPHALAGEASDLPAGVGSYSLTEWGQILDSFYSAAKGMLPLIESGVGELPFSLEALPSDGLFSRYIAPTKTWTQRSETGVYSHSESSFGPEVPLVFTGALAGGLLAVRQEEEWDSREYELEAEVVESGGHTLDALSEVKIGLVVYRSDQGAYPERLEQLTRSTANFPEGYLEGPELPLDEWGGALHFELSEDGSSFRLWSAGPDGVDQGGAGDDVSL